MLSAQSVLIEEKMSLRSNISEQPRLLDIERAKGLAIILVVIGHLISGDPPPGDEWYVTFRNAIYEFHMPFFMYLSGFVFFLANAQNALAFGYVPYVGRRARRLLVPFFVFGVLVVFGKVIAGRFLHVDNVPESLVTGLMHLLIGTSASAARSVWYVYVLFVYCAVTPLLWAIFRRHMWLLCFAALAIYISPESDLLYLDRIGRFYVFFVFGGVVALHREVAMDLFGRFFAFWCCAFVGSFFIFWPPSPASAPGLVSFLLIGGFSIPVLHQFVRLRVFERDWLLLSLGSFAFVIYLFNTIFIGLTKGVLLKIVPFTADYFLLSLAVIFLGGVLLPIVAKRYVLRHSQTLDQLTS